MRLCSFIWAEVCCVWKGVCWWFFFIIFLLKLWSVSFRSALQQSGSNQLKAWKRHYVIAEDKKKSPSQCWGLVAEASVWPHPSQDLWRTLCSSGPSQKNSLCQISTNNSGISFPCLWSVGVLESLACVGRDSLAKIKTVLQSCIREKEKES